MIDAVNVTRFLHLSVAVFITEVTGAYGFSYGSSKFESILYYSCDREYEMLTSTHVRLFQFMTSLDDKENRCMMHGSLSITIFESRQR